MKLSKRTVLLQLQIQLIQLELGRVATVGKAIHLRVLCGARHVESCRVPPIVVETPTAIRLANKNRQDLAE